MLLINKIRGEIGPYKGVSYYLVDQLDDFLNTVRAEKERILRDADPDAYVAVPEAHGDGGKGGIEWQILSPTLTSLGNGRTPIPFATFTAELEELAISLAADWSVARELRLYREEEVLEVVPELVHIKLLPADDQL